MKIRSIRTRLTLWYTGLLAITFLILGAIACTVVVYTIYEETDSALKSVAMALAEKSRTESRFSIPPEAGDNLRHFFGPVPMEPYFEWLDPRANVGEGMRDSQGIPFTPEAWQNALNHIATYETVMMRGEPYPVRVLTWPVVDSGKVASVIRVGISRMNLYKSTYRFLLVMAVLFPFAVLLAGGGGWFFAHRALSPVDRMAETARKIDAGQLHERIQLTGARDELDRLAGTLNGMLARIEAAFTEMRQFTADASHELQTPLTILRGEIEWALRSRRSEEEYTDTLKSALEEIERISALVEGLLLLARSDAGVLKADHKTVDLNLLTEEVLGQLGPLAGQKTVSLKLGDLEPLLVSGDFALLRRLLLNLVDNAIKYTPAGGVVKVSINRDGDFAVLAVQDSGPGIAPEEQEKVFQRFYRSPEARASGQGGSGLGLSIVKSIADAHRGRVELANPAGGGSVFSVLLPLAAEI